MEKKPISRRLKWPLITAGALAATVGTFYGNEGYLPPIYVNKTGDSGGIAIGAYVHINEGTTFNGIIIAPSVKLDGTLNGVSINVYNRSNGKINGLELGLFDDPQYNEKNINGLDIGFLNTADKVNGLRIGMSNFSKSRGTYLDLGLLNVTPDVGSTGFLLHIDEDKKDEER